MSKLKEVSHETHFGHMCHCVSLAAPCVYGGSCKTFRLRKCQSVKIGGSVARNARFEASTCVVSSFWLFSGSAVSMGEVSEIYLFQGVTRSRGFPLASQCLWGKLQKHFLFKVS